MRLNMKKILLLANIVLLGIVCFSAVATVNKQTAEITQQRMSSICQHILPKIVAGTMTLEQAGTYAAEKGRVGDSVPIVNIAYQGADLILQSDQPIFSAGLLGGGEKTAQNVNCTQLAGA